MNRLFWQTKTFWAMVSTILGGLGTTWSFVLEAHVIAKATFVSLGVVSAALEVFFLADRVSFEATQTRSVVMTGRGTNGAVPATESNPTGNALVAELNTPPQAPIGPRPF